MIHVLTYRWGTKFSLSDVAKLEAGVKRHLKQEYSFTCYDPSLGPDRDLTKIKGCFSRLRMFDPGWQMYVLRASRGERIVCLDLDLIVTGPLDDALDRPEPFVILGGANASNPCPFNGSVMMVRAGSHPELWNDFSIEAAQKISFYEFPDDQGWIWHKLPQAAIWKCGPESGFYAFQKPGWPKKTTDLPRDAKLVAFPGWREPSKFTHLEWVQRHWRE